MTLLDRVKQDVKTLLVTAIGVYIDCNVTGWEVVTCNVCGRNSDYEHKPNDPDCPVGLAIRLRDSLARFTLSPKHHTLPR